MAAQVVAVLPPQPSSASLARDLVAMVCHDWDLDGLLDDLALVVTELVGNAIRHAGTDMEVRLVAIAGGVRLEVHDGSTEPLRPRPAAPSDEGGRGLMLVDALSTRYGVDRDPPGKRVWVEFLAGARPVSSLM
jgi:anti-sigma regulatory factor (Ser/Thr protein kinase)